MYYEHVWLLLALLWIFGWTGFVILAKYLRNRNRLRVRDLIHRERMTAMEKGIPLTELPDHLEGQSWGDDVWERKPSDTQWDRMIALGLGLLLLFGGAGTTLGLMMLGETRETLEAKAMAPLGLIPALMGIGLLLYYYLSRSRKS